MAELLVKLVMVAMKAVSVIEDVHLILHLIYFYLFESLLDVKLYIENESISTHFLVKPYRRQQKMNGFHHKLHRTSPQFFSARHVRTRRVRQKKINYFIQFFVTFYGYR